MVGLFSKTFPPLLLALTKVFLRLLALGDVHHRSDELDVAFVVLYGMRCDANVLDPAVGKEKSVLMREVPPLLRRARHDLRKTREVLRMHSLMH